MPAKKKDQSETKAETASNNQQKKKATTITDLPGIGPSTAAKLVEAGFSTLESIATVSTGELSSIASLGEKTVIKIRNKNNTRWDFFILAIKYKLF